MARPSEAGSGVVYILVRMREVVEEMQPLGARGDEVN